MKEYLEKSAKERGTILCFGIDPVLERMKSRKKDVTKKIVSYYSAITDLLLEENEIAAIKPNYAYFAQYGFDGLHALKEIMDRYSGKIPVILDAKRGDIGKTSEAYAAEVFDFWGADAVTASPFMGQDSVAPLMRKGKLIYLLCRTTNPGARDFQELIVGGKRLYEVVVMKGIFWGCGLVVGATSESIKKIAAMTGASIPLLIPGVGAQGGDLKMVLEAIKDNAAIHRINSSSSIAFAHEKYKGTPEKAAIKEAKSLNKTIRKYI